jgi:hypothetical protein
MDADDVADHLVTVLEGAFVMAKLFDDPGFVVRSLGHYRAYLEGLFGLESAAGAVEAAS